MVSLERGWANSKPPVASPWSNSGPSATCHSADAGPIPHYWPCLFQGKLGQSHAIGIVSLEGDWANSMLSVAPLWGDHGPSAAHRSAGAGPIPHYWPCLFRQVLGQSNAIGIVSLEGDWAYLKILVAPLGATAGYCQHVIWQVLGQFLTIGHACCKGSWANPMLLAFFLYRGAGPTQCYQ